MIDKQKDKFQLFERVNEFDEHGELPLELALKLKLDGMAENLVRHQADINRFDEQHRTLLHLSIERGSIDNR